MYRADKNKHMESINLPSVTVASILETNPPLIGSLFIGADDAGAGVVAAVLIILYKQQIQEDINNIWERELKFRTFLYQTNL